MQFALFADLPVGRIIVFAIVAAYWVISYIGKAIAQQQKQAEAARNAMPRPRLPANKPDATAELEQFLNELGFKRAPEKPVGSAAPPTVARKQEPRPRPVKRVEPPPIRARAKAPPALVAAPVEQRHLRSQLESRHQESMHSQLESKHLDSKVAHRHLGADEHQSTEAVPSQSLVPTIAGTFRNRHALVNAFIMSEVFGPPISMRE